MFLTQTYLELGQPDWTPVGAFAEIVEGPTDHCGYGTGGYTAIMEKATRFLYEKYGAQIKVLNTKMERISGSGHPSYRVLALFITGDMYREETQKPHSSSMATQRQVPPKDLARAVSKIRKKINE